MSYRRSKLSLEKNSSDTISPIADGYGLFGVGFDIYNCMLFNAKSFPPPTFSHMHIFVHILMLTYLHEPEHTV